MTAKSSILLNFNEKCQSRQNLRDASADWIKLCQDIVSRRDIAAEFEAFFPHLLKHSLKSNNSSIAHNLNNFVKI